jgi:hypothetical protein
MLFSEDLYVSYRGSLIALFVPNEDPSSFPRSCVRAPEASYNWVVLSWFSSTSLPFPVRSCFMM